MGDGLHDDISLAAANLVIQRVDAIVPIDPLKSGIARDGGRCRVEGCGLAQQVGPEVACRDDVQQKGEGLAVAVAGEEGSVEFEPEVVVVGGDAELLGEGVAQDGAEQHVRGAFALEGD